MDSRKLTVSGMIEFVNTDLVYKPGWAIRAERATDRPFGLTMTATFTAPNSNRDQAAAGYPNSETVTPVPSLTVSWGDDEEGVTQDQALELVLMFLVDIEIHEAREFLRVKSDNYAAPFHPHHWSGHARWGFMDASWPTSFADPEGDMEIGLHEDAQESTLAREVLDDYHSFMARRQGGGGLPPELAELLQGLMGGEGPQYGPVGGDPLAGLFNPADAEDPTEALMRQLFGR